MRRPWGISGDHEIYPWDKLTNASTSLWIFTVKVQKMYPWGTMKGTWNVSKLSLYNSYIVIYKYIYTYSFLQTFIFHMCAYVFVCEYVCIDNSWSWNYIQMVVSTRWVLGIKLTSFQEQYMLLTVESSISLCPNFWYFRNKVNGTSMDRLKLYEGHRAP